MENTTTVKEHFIIKIRRNDNSIVYWATRLKNTNITPDVEKAKKYKDYDEAKKKAFQITEMNGVVTFVVKYTTTVEIEHTDIIPPFKSPNKLNFWDYIATIDQKKEYDKWRLTMDIANEYHAMAKDPDKFLDEIIKKVEEKLKTK
jgi:hypothetical protein